MSTGCIGTTTLVWYNILREEGVLARFFRDGKEKLESTISCSIDDLYFIYFLGGNGGQ
jgi:hypothetical protein